jgi:hypothetical protein
MSKTAETEATATAATAAATAAARAQTSAAAATTAEAPPATIAVTRKTAKRRQAARWARNNPQIARDMKYNIHMKYTGAKIEGAVFTMRGLLLLFKFLAGFLDACLASCRARTSAGLCPSSVPLADTERRQDTESRKTRSRKT